MKSIETIKTVSNLGRGKDTCHYILLTVHYQDCPHSSLGVGVVPGVASMELVLSGAVPAEPVLRLVGAPPGPLSVMLRGGL